MKTALVVIDVQAYFMRRTPADLPGKIADYIRQHRHDLLVFTIFQNTDGSFFERNLHWDRCKNPEDLVLAPELQPFATDENTYVKQTFSAFKQPAFAEYLRSRGIKKLKLCGVDLEDCMLGTLFEAFDLGYEVEVLFDLSWARFSTKEAITSIILRDIQTKN
jgi:nicotinamidase-related amidase